VSSSATDSASGPASASARSGAWAAALCYLLWGAFPLYWKQLHAINPVELIAHRYVWTFVVVLVFIFAQRRLDEVRAAVGTTCGFGINALSATLLTANWLVYVWGVNTGHVIETSLGYFLVPLVNVAAGRFVLHEHLRRLQWIAIGCAAAGVALMIFQIGHPPWIALILAGTWGGYSLMRKQSPLGAVIGLTVETLLVVPFALAYLIWRQSTGSAAFGHVDTFSHTLMIGAGIVTAVPLVLFAFAARRIRLSTLGLLQYVAPSVQFAIGVGVYHETLSRDRAMSFAFIWIGLALYTADNLWAQRKASL
jgi:chloramphenicol-sensitive protein RarD